MIDTAFSKLAHTEELITWSERLSEYNGREAAAKILLNALCTSENGLTKQQLSTLCMQYFPDSNPLDTEQHTSVTLNMLEHDGYLIRTAEGIRRFRSPLLREWWKYKFVE